MRPMFILAGCVMLVMGSFSARSAAPVSLVIDNFEDQAVSSRWNFSDGPEFPGAKGSFARSETAAHAGGFGGQLNFDFKGGGRYVAAVFNLTPAQQREATNFNALELWVNSPEGSLVFRYSDQSGQTLQKQVECAAGRWERLVIPFSNWTGHWGGPNDGKVRGAPRSVALLVDHGQLQTGALLFDDLRLVQNDDKPVRLAYPAYRFAPEEGWRIRADGNGGSTRLEGGKAVLDFSQGARSITLSVPDHVLLGQADKIHFRVRGKVQGHPVRLVARTHFMTFHKQIGEFSGEGEQDLVTDGPPGTGWEWRGGENDGKMHGPLRLGEIQFAANGRADRCELDLLEVLVEASCPPEKRCLLTADLQADAQSPVFRAQVRALSEQAMTGSLRWTLRNWGGDVLKQGETPLTIAPKGQLTEWRLQVEPAWLPKDIKFIEAEFALEIPGQKTAPAQAAWLAPVSWEVDSKLDPASPFGMGIYLNRYGGDTRGLASMEQTAQMASKAGAKWTREDFSWSRVEPRRGEFDWSFYDRLVECAKRNGITVYGIAAYWSSWTKPYTEEGIQDYLNYVRAMVRHYRQDIKYWEIWNEPNIFFWQGPREMYGDMLIRSYKAIKEVDPDAQVLGLSTAGIDFAFIDKMLGLKTPFDILTIHPYRTRLDDLEFISDLKRASDKVQLPDGRRRPVWLTEMGWSTFAPHHVHKQDFASTTLRAQAELIARSYLCAIVSGVEPRTFWYNFRNDGDDPVYFEHQMGIVYRDYRPKPAYIAFGTLAHLLRDTKLAEKLTIDETTLAYRFTSRNPDREVIALWNPQRDVQISLATQGKQQVICVNTVGEQTELPVREGKVGVSLKKGVPVYLVSK